MLFESHVFTPFHSAGTEMELWIAVGARGMYGGGEVSYDCVEPFLCNFLTKKNIIEEAKLFSASYKYSAFRKSLCTYKRCWK
jgi:hypothetical protein